jgi:hypothetical protein
MKKEEIVAALDGIKNMTPVISIHSVLEMLEKMEPEVRIEKVLGCSQDLADELFNRIEKALDYNADGLVDTDSAEFELSYSNQIELRSASINVYDTMKHIEACLAEFVVEAEAEEDMTFSRDEEYDYDDPNGGHNGRVFIDSRPPSSPEALNGHRLGGTLDNEMS